MDGTINKTEIVESKSIPTATMNPTSAIIGTPLAINERNTFLLLTSQA